MKGSIWNVQPMNNACTAISKVLIRGGGKRPLKFAVCTFGITETQKEVTF